MGIEGIGKGGAPPVAPASGREASEVDRAPAPDATRAFEAPGASIPAGAGTAETAAASVGPAAPAAPANEALGALRSGTVDLDGYLDLKVHEATAHLGPLPAADLVRVRAALRERLATDPALVDLVKSATGSVPRVPDDD
jgi:hypothetical protein